MIQKMRLFAQRSPRARHHGEALYCVSRGSPLVTHFFLYNDNHTAIEWRGVQFLISIKQRPILYVVFMADVSFEAAVGFLDS